MDFDMNFFENIKLDKNKETVVIIGNTSTHRHVNAYAIGISKSKWLNDNYNVVIISETGSNKYNADNVILLNVKTVGFLKKADKEEKPKLTDKIAETLSDYFKPKYIINALSLPLLPNTKRVPKKHSETLNAKGQDFHDYVEEPSSEDLKVIEYYLKYHIKGRKALEKLYSTRLRSRVNPNILLKFILTSAEKYNTKVSYFIFDPAALYPFYRVNGIKAKGFYFANDKRGSRDLNTFDIAQVQLFAGEQVHKDIFGIPKKEKLLFFAGTLFIEKGDRAELYYKFLKNLSVEHDLYIPLKANAIATRKNIPEHQEEKIKTKFTELYNEIKNNPNWKGHLTPDVVNAISAKYKYGLIMRCHSPADSLNFRPVTYTYYKIFPLLDHKYDPEYLQIPKEIQDKIVVRDHKDIEERIAYYEANPEEKEKVFTELRELFRIDQWIKNTSEMLDNEVKKLIW